MKIEMGNGWIKTLQGRIERYEFDLGVLEDGPHYEPVETKIFGVAQTTNYAGGPIRKTSNKQSGKTIGEVLIENMRRLNINLLLRPFQERNSDIIQFTQYFLRVAMKAPGANIRRVENLLQAIVRNPILKQEYGKNKAATADAKGFDRHMIDTGQMFKAIEARAKRV